MIVPTMVPTIPAPAACTPAGAAPSPDSLAVAFAGRRVHFAGIGGSGMNGLAHMLLGAGAVVTGTDREDSAILTSLREHGAAVALEHEQRSLPLGVELLVYSAALTADHPALREAQRRGLPTLKYAQMLGEIMRHKQGIAIAGTHGKSTTTALTAYILTRAGLDPSFVVGASCRQLGGSAHAGRGNSFVVEACEYDRSFHNLAPWIGAALNVEEDHLDYYGNLSEIVEAFGGFLARIPAAGLALIQNTASCQQAVAAVTAKVETYATFGPADWTAHDVIQQDHQLDFAVRYQGNLLGRMRLRIPGRHNIGNALAAAAIAWHCGVPWAVITAAVGDFRGAGRRSEWLGCFKGITLVDDYGHHPTEIRATLAALREHYHPERLICVFQPHQYSRTRLLLEDFARSFNAADLTIVAEIYFVRDRQADRAAISAATLVERMETQGREALYIPAFDHIVEHLAAAGRPGDLIVSMGAGPVWEVTHGLVRRLQSDSRT